MSGASPRCARGRAVPRFELSRVLRGKPYEVAMQAQVAGELRVEAQREDAVVPHGYGMTLIGRHHFHVACPLHKRRTDEDARKFLAVHPLDVQRRLEAVELAAITVA